MIKLGIIGAGNRGTISLLAHRPEEGVILAAASDINSHFLDELQESVGSPLFLTSDYREMLKQSDLDAVMVFSPDDLHEEHASAVIRSGKALFIEKPLSSTVESCDRIIRLAARMGTRLYIGHNMRHMFFLQKMKQLIDEGAIGEVKTIWVRHFISRGGDCYFKDWHADRSRSNSLLVHKAVHDIDAIHWLAGADTSRIQGMGGLTLYGEIQDRKERAPGEQDRSMEHWPPKSLKGLNPVVDVEDLSLIQMQLENGVFASYQQCHYTPDYWRNYTVIGTEGRIENFGTRTEGTVIRLYNRKQLYSPDGDARFPVPREYMNGESPDRRELDEFIAFLKGEADPACSPASARAAVAAADMATRSLRNGGTPIDIPPFTDSL